MHPIDAVEETPARVLGRWSTRNLKCYCLRRCTGSLEKGYSSVGEQLGLENQKTVQGSVSVLTVNHAFAQFMVRDRGLLL